MSGKFSMETLAGEIVPVVTEKYEFDCRDKSIIIFFSDYSDSWVYDGKIRKVKFPIELSSTKFKFSMRTLLEELRFMIDEKKFLNFDKIHCK